MINLFQPSVSAESLENLKEVFDSNWLGRGEMVRIFEKHLASYLEDLNIHTIASASNGIDGVYDIFNLKRGDEIIIPTNSFPVIASSAKLRGLKVVIVDVNSFTGNICMNSLEKAITKKTKAVFITHYGGIPVDVEKIRALISDEVLIFEDSACALGTKINGISCGIGGDFSVWSFDAMKLVVCGEGGAMHFRSSEMLNRAKEYFYLGLPSKSKSGLDSAKDGKNWWEYDLSLLGIRSIFTNINAAIGMPQILDIDNKLIRKREIAVKYDDELKEEFTNHRSHYLSSDIEYSNYFYTIQTDKRDLLAHYLLEKGIYSSLRYSPLHKMKLFHNDSRLTYKGADSFFSRSLNIPIHSSLNNAEVEKVIKSLNEF